MNTFFKYIAIVVVISFISLKGLDYAYTSIYNNSKRSKFQYFKSFSNKEIDYIFLGSSRVENGLNPTVIDSITGTNSINMGIQGSRLKDVFLFLKLIDAYKIKNKEIYVQLDYIFNMQDGKSKFLEYQLIPFYKENRIIKDYLSETKELRFYDKIPFIRYSVFDQKNGVREIVSCLINKKSNVFVNNGFAPVFSTNMKSRYSLPEDISKNDTLFKSILKFIDEKNMNVKFFCSPIRKDTKNLDYITKLKRLVPSLIDFSGTIKDNKLFKDNLHLNSVGSRQFSILFANQLD